ncbi:family 10 glycosylhydrolase [Anabaena azotica]|uniref:family 10 glycosylhydrolase n=1 Tax=Anabaena azotica TaxID=197653 RepID=UPI0039A7232A
MSNKKKEPSGCGCANIPLSVIIFILAGGYWLFTQKDNLGISNLLSQAQQIINPIFNSTPIITPTPETIPQITPSFAASIIPKNTPSNQPTAIKTAIPKTAPLPVNPWEKKAIRGIYLSRYQVTNNASEKMIRERVRYYRSQGFNTIIHGVWGNGCTMYNSKVMQQTLGYKSCPNQFQDQWLDWLIDEAHKQGMQVHAYFEKGIKIDKNSPIFDLAIEKKWVVPGVDKTYPAIEHYVLDVEIPEVANFFKNILVEFVQRYPQIDAVQWDDYLGYHAELPGKVDRTAKLTAFVQQMITGMKKANPNVSFDICHHNPYWAKRYFAADWEKWNVDRVFIQVYNDANFQEELNYVKNYDGIAISEPQFHRLKALLDNSEVKSVLVFPASGKPEQTASTVNNLIKNTK